MICFPIRERSQRLTQDFPSIKKQSIRGVNATIMFSLFTFFGTDHQLVTSSNMIDISFTKRSKMRQNMFFYWITITETYTGFFLHVPIHTVTYLKMDTHTVTYVSFHTALFNQKSRKAFVTITKDFTQIFLQ